MRIRKVRLKNGYKRFRDLTIDLGPTPARVVALVGPNGCGKSSVLDGLLYHANAHGRLGRGGSLDHTYHSLDNDPAFSWQNVEIEFTTGTYASIRAEKATSGKEGTIFSFRSPYRYNSRLKIKETKSTGEIRLNNYGAGDASSLDDKMEDSYRRLYAVYNEYMNQNDVKPSEAKAKIIGDLNKSIKKCIDIEVSSIGNVDSGKGTLYFSKTDHPNEFEFNVLSSGEKEVVDILLDLYLRKADYNDSIFLIDEPELHINTAIQRKLLIEINRMVGKDCQIWLTTHSIGFLRALQNELSGQYQIIQFHPEHDLAAMPQTLRPTTMTPAAWRSLFSVALDDLANLISPKTIIYCEGRDTPGRGGQERGMDAQALNNIFSESHPETLFISSGGNTELDQRSTVAIAILGKVFPTLEILVLKDRDMASGKDATEHDRKIYLDTNADNHRVMKRWEIENYLFDKEVLKAYCNQQNKQFDEAAYDAFVTDPMNQDLKAEANRMKNLCGIKGSINADTFKLLLSKCFSADMNVYRELRECIFERK